MKKLLKKIKHIIIGDYSPDVALRYLPTIDIIKKEGLGNCRLLEFGSGDTGITPYFKKNITGLDVIFGDRQSSLVKRVKYDGEQFPFKDNDFGLVLSVDSLEHVVPKKRPVVINEMLRIAESAIIIVVPCGANANKHDIELRTLFKKIHGRSDKFFEDHIKNGLPEENELKAMLINVANSMNKTIEISTHKLLNINIRKIYMRFSIKKGIIDGILYYCFLFLLPFRKLLNFGNCYRLMFYIKIKK